MTRFARLTAGQLSMSALLAEPPVENLLWFGAPATHFTQSCPLGNGRLGAMVFGGVEEERIVLDEGKLTEAAICSVGGTAGKVRLGASAVDLQLHPRESVRLGPELRRP